MAVDVALKPSSINVGAVRSSGITVPAADAASPTTCRWTASRLEYEGIVNVHGRT